MSHSTRASRSLRRSTRLQRTESKLSSGMPAGALATSAVDRVRSVRAQERDQQMLEKTLKEFETEVEVRCRQMKLQGVRLEGVLQNIMTYELFKIPERVRDMKLSDFRKEFSGSVSHAIAATPYKRSVRKVPNTILRSDTILSPLGISKPRTGSSSQSQSNSSSSTQSSALSDLQLPSSRRAMKTPRRDALSSKPPASARAPQFFGGIRAPPPSTAAPEQSTASGPQPGHRQQQALEKLEAMQRDLDALMEGL